ncbi:hypothetical protein JXJ21_11075 [candidate division KSB1 bacterium]|nr:hypothetical protein [candidate division KSB1 bacterium]
MVLAKNIAYFILATTLIFFQPKDAKSNQINVLSDSVQADKLKRIEAELDTLKYLRIQMNDAKEHVYHTHSISIESANRTFAIMQLTIGLLFIGLLGGFYGWVRMLRQVKKYARENANIQITNIKESAQNEAKQMLDKIETETKKKIDDEFATANKTLQRDVRTISENLLSYDLLFQLHSAEDQQAIALQNIIQNPEKDNPLFISTLLNLSKSPNPIIRAQSMLARYRCSDETGYSDLLELRKSKDPAMREAAEEALSEITK